MPSGNYYDGLATISKLLQITGLCCKRSLQKRLYSAKETYNCKEPTNRGHPIPSFHETQCRKLIKLYMYSLVETPTRNLKETGGHVCAVTTVVMTRELEISNRDSEVLAHEFTGNSLSRDKD